MTTWRAGNMGKPIEDGRFVMQRPSLRLIHVILLGRLRGLNKALNYDSR